MKKPLVLIVLFLSNYLDLSAQGSWIQKANFGGTARYGAVGFSIGSKGYIGTGRDNISERTDFWEWDQASNIWTQKANFGGPARSSAVGFSLGNMGYIGTGKNGNTYYNDFWEYNPSGNIWTQKANFGGAARYAAVGFAIGMKGYIGTGDTSACSQCHKKDFWEWDQATDTWIQKANFGGTARASAVGFSISSKGYIGTGFDGIFKDDFWEWDQATDSWVQKANFGGVSRNTAVGFSIGSKGYIGVGQKMNNLTQDFWEWDQASNIWTQKANFGGTARWLAVGFSIGNKGFIGIGLDATYCQDFWEWDPNCAISVSGSASTINCSSSVTLTAAFSPTVNATYSWFPSTALSNTSIANPVANPIVTTTYSVIVQDTITQCMGKDIFTITVVPPTYSITGSANHYITCGTSDSLTVFGPGNNVIYSWSPTTGLSNPNIFNPIASPLNTTYYQVFVTDTVTQCVGSSQYNLYVTPLSIIVTGSFFQCPGGQSETLCSSGDGAYMWSTGQTTSCIVVSPSVTTTYTVGVTTLNGCYASSGTTVVIGSSSSGGLTQTYNDSACGLNFVTAHQLIETRTAQLTPPYDSTGTGLPTTLSISGLSASDSILKSYLWYTVSYIGSTPQPTSVVFTNTIPATNTVSATIIGTGTNKCWGETGTVNYRADVTPFISGNGNYDIDISGITGTGGLFPNWYDQIDGVSMMIIFKDNSATYQGSLVIWDGNFTKNNVTGTGICKTMTGINACATDTNAQAFLLISDRQANTTGGIHPSTVNGVTSFYQNEFWNWDQTQTTVTAGQTTIDFATDGQDIDCYDWAVMGLYYQTTTCVNCSTTAIGPTPTNELVSIYPNPFSTQTVFHSDNIFYNATLTAYNCLGLIVGQIKNINGHTFPFNRDNLPSGLYYVRLTEGGKIIAADKLVITDK